MKYMNIGARIAIVFFCVLLMVIIVLSGATNRFLRKNIEDDIRSTVALAAQSNARLVNDLVSRLETFSSLISNAQSEIATMLNGGTGSTIEDYQAFYRLRDMLDENLDTVFGSLVRSYGGCLILHEDILMAELASKNRPDAVFALESNMFMLIRNDYVTGEDWYRASLEQNSQPYWFVSNEDSQTLCMARELVHYRYDSAARKLSRQNMGVLLVAMDTAWIHEQIAQSQLMNGARVIIFSDSGQAIYASDGRLDVEQEEYAHLQSGDKSLYIWTHELDNGLIMRTVVPASEIHRVSRRSVWMLIEIEGIVLVVGSLLILLCAQKMTRPIRLLAAHMHSTQQRPQRIEIPAHLASELEILYHRFNEHVERIDGLLEEVRATEHERQIEQIRTLQAQINPHFIYNTLDNVCCRALESGEDDLASTLNDLSDMLRFNLKEPDRYVTLGEIFDNVRLYVGLLQARRRDKLTLHIDAQEETLSCRIQKMLIQPLVENSISYGVENPVVHIKAALQGEALVIFVLDQNREADVEAINMHLAGTRTLEGKSTGMGIRNIDRRIRMTFGSPYGLRYERSPDGGCAAILLIPALRSETIENRLSDK